MIDLLLTMSAFILVGSMLLPMTINLMIESSHEKEIFTANALLYEKLHELLSTKQLPQYQLIEKQGKSYEFIPGPDQKEVCIHFEDRYQKPKKVCEFWE